MCDVVGLHGWQLELTDSNNTLHDMSVRWGQTAQQTLPGIRARSAHISTLSLLENVLFGCHGH